MSEPVLGDTDEDSGDQGLICKRILRSKVLLAFVCRLQNSKRRSSNVFHRRIVIQVQSAKVKDSVFWGRLVIPVFYGIRIGFEGLQRKYLDQNALDVRVSHSWLSCLC